MSMNRRDPRQLNLAISVNLKQLFDTTAGGILAVDPCGKVLFFNKRFSELWKIPLTVLDSCDDNAMIHHVAIKVLLARVL